MFDFIIWKYVEFQANTTIYLLSNAIYFGLNSKNCTKIKEKGKFNKRGGGLFPSAISPDPPFSALGLLPRSTQNP